MANNVNINAVITAEDRASKTLKSFSAATESSMKKIGAVMAVVGAGLTLFAKSATDFTRDLVKDTKVLQRETGATAQEASGLIYVMNRMGLSAEDASKNFGLFSKQIVETARSSNPSATALGRLNINVKDVDGSVRGFNQVLLDTADAFSKMRDGPEKTAAALELFGRGGKDMIKILNLGKDGILELTKKAKELGLTLDQETITSVSKYIASQKTLKDTTNSLKIQIAALTTPVLTKFNTKLNDVISTLAKSSGPIKTVVANIGAFGGPILIAAGGALEFAANFKGAGLSLLTIGKTILRLIPAFALLTAAGAAVVGVFKIFGKISDNIRGVVKRQDEGEKELNQTLQEQVTTLEDVKKATEELTDAKLDVTGASLDLERAQRNYNEAVKEYGPDSLEAREAAYNLEVAKGRLADAQQRVVDTQAEANKKEAELAAQTPIIVKAIDLRVQKFGTLAGTLQTSINKADLLDKKIISIGQLTQPAQIANTLQNANSNVIQLGRNLSNLQNSGFQVQGMGTNFNPRLRAGGGEVRKNSPYIVGEEGPELFIPSDSGNIIPNEKLSHATTINMNVNVGMYAGTELEKRKIAEALFRSLKDIASARNMSLDQMMAR